MMSNWYSLPPARMPFSVIPDWSVRLVVHQQHVVLVEGLEVVGVQRLALGPVVVALRDQLLGHLRVLYGRADLALEVVGDDVVGFFAEEHVLVVGQPEREAAGVPRLSSSRSRSSSDTSSADFGMK